MRWDERGASESRGLLRVTVAICTWNRARLLDRTLANFRALRVPPGVEWELLVVNNNSTDTTDAVIAHHALVLPIRRLFEPEPGQSPARNRAIAGASGDLILWTDDDVLVDPDWLALYAEAATAWPEAAYFGGTIDPQFEQEPPAWVAANLDRLADAYAICRLGEGTRPLRPGEFVLGANMATRARVFRDLDFDVAFGHSRAEKIGGDDVFLQHRLRETGSYGVWVGAARVRHMIPADRVTPGFLRHCFRGHGRAMARWEGPWEGPRLLGFPRSAVRRYLSARLALVRGRVGGRRWVDALATSAFLEGYLAEARRRGPSPLDRRSSWVSPPNSSFSSPMPAATGSPSAGP